MAIRAKFKLVERIESTFHPDYPPTTTVKFRAEYDETIPEDQCFLKATPWGEFSMTVDNPAALEQLIPGRYYYFDITRADAFDTVPE